MRHKRRQPASASSLVGEHVLHSVLRHVHVNPHYTPGASPVVGRFQGIAVGQTCLQEEPAPGPRETDGVRLATSHRSRKRSSVARKKRKEVVAFVPARIVRARASSPRVVVQLQKSVGDDRPQIRSANALEKSGQGRVNGGLARSDERRVRPSQGTPSRTVDRRSSSPVKTREHRQQAQGDVERWSPSGSPIPQVV